MCFKCFIIHRLGDWNRSCTLTLFRTALYGEIILGVDKVYYNSTEIGERSSYLRTCLFYACLLFLCMSQEVFFHNKENTFITKEFPDNL